mmetsp:Transcript_30755/g.80459  ORF Transcript_30755/g.80459 Transcript_30755/m.80459 type:complete len:99 (+) Transcript_30755:491-787(+)
MFPIEEKKTLLEPPIHKTKTTGKLHECGNAPYADIRFTVSFLSSDSLVRLFHFLFFLFFSLFMFCGFHPPGWDGHRARAACTHLSLQKTDQTRFPLPK